MKDQEGQGHIEANCDNAGTDTAAERKLRFIERRRPGRVSYMNPSLIGLLRRSRATEDKPAELADADAAIDDMAPAKGMMLGGAIGALLWGAAVLILWLIIR